MRCLKINLQVRTTNPDVVGFYRRLGYEIEERISMSRGLAGSARRRSLPQTDGARQMLSESGTV